ncbi:DUF5985 family protein [Vitiosangium sp. GDMCC 1.1324]|uniref:DUF5985 family protein n=1 Tax=Vitiosangium sp. (strain GDMCC 1.1324) TaxID=2138576 RepID=UPI000D3A426B|nr:DUF5985 family protein [Vitiosangium sp. GDMCC 1.1324]PTL84454.1 hypothetical protein DAT35_05020 [Vitiosangium sp. GDMCC 1.1324]
MAEVVFLLCAATSLACAVLLLRGYARNKVRLLLWSSLCFVGLAVNNVLLVMDLMVISDRSLLLFRNVSGLLSLALLVFGLVWDSE